MKYVECKPTVSLAPEDASNGIIRISFADVTLCLKPIEASWLAANLQREIRNSENDHRDKLDSNPELGRLCELVPGDEVRVRNDGGVEADYTVTKHPWQLGHGEWVIGLAGISGGYALRRVTRIIYRRPF